MIPFLHSLLAVASVSVPNIPDQHTGQLLTYKLIPGTTLKYRIQADVTASIPILDSKEPVDITATVKMVYLAKPKTKLKDGTSDIDFIVEPGSAEIEVAKIPFPVTDEQAKEILNQSVSMSKLGEVKNSSGLKPLPFADTIPGVDPRRLFALMFPIVFPDKAVSNGSSWTFKSELLGGPGMNPKFSATYLDLNVGNKAPKVPVSTAKGGSTEAKRNLTTVFDMPVDQSLNADKHSAGPAEEVYKRRTGTIKGSGSFNLDISGGHITSGKINITANLKDLLVAKPKTEDEPKEIISKVDATITVDLIPAKAAKQ